MGLVRSRGVLERSEVREVQQMARRVSRREFLKGAALSPLALALLAHGRGLFAAEPKRPNIILFMSDDHDLRDLGCMGNEGIVTPNLDRFAGEGAICTRAYTPSAVCMPSRAMMLTGLYPHTSGVYRFGPVRPGTRTLPAMLKEAGYVTGLIGKAHIAPKELYPFDYVWTKEKKGNWGGAPSREPKPFGEHMSAFLKQAGDKPFFGYINSADPHRPWPNVGRPLRRRIMGKPSPHDPAKVEVPGFLPDLRETRLDLVCYYDAVYRMDACFSAVMTELVKAGKADNTLVIFMGDNGVALPFAKTNLYDAGVHMPFLVRWPGVVKPGSRIDAMLSFMDITPTCLEAAGVKVPASIQGKSFLPVLRGARKTQHDWLFLSHTDHVVSSYPCRSIITDKYQYIYNLSPQMKFRNVAFGTRTWKAMVKLAETDPKMAERVKLFSKRPREELFDLKNDPWELANLARKPEHAKVQKEFYERMRAKMQEIRDPWLKRVKPFGA